MGISDLYAGIGRKRNVSQFANIVRIAKSDGKITPEEIAFLDKVAKKYNISNEEFKLILKDPEKIPTIAYLDCIERIERLYELLLMVKADKKVQNEEIAVMRKIATGLAFPLHEVDRIVDISLKEDPGDTDLDKFTRTILDLLHMK